MLNNSNISHKHVHLLYVGQIRLCAEEHIRCVRITNPCVEHIPQCGAVLYRCLSSVYAMFGVCVRLMYGLYIMCYVYVLCQVMCMC